MISRELLIRRLSVCYALQWTRIPDYCKALSSVCMSCIWRGLLLSVNHRLKVVKRSLVCVSSGDHFPALEWKYSNMCRISAELFVYYGHLSHSSLKVLVDL